MTLLPPENYQPLHGLAERLRELSSTSTSHSIDVSSLNKTPFDLSRLSYHEATKVELVEYLLAAAEKVGNQQHAPATDLLDLCDCLSSKTGDPVQRLVYYFSQSLRQTMQRQLGRRIAAATDEPPQAIPTSLVVQSIHAKIPFYRVSPLAGIQILLENVAVSRRVHVIDLEVGTGMQWPAMMQALATRRDGRPTQLLKITAVGTKKERNMIEQTGRWLASFAQTLSLTFCFRVVTADDIVDLEEELLDSSADPREALVVYSEYNLTSLIASAGRTEALMKLIRNLKPRIMVVLEVEGNHHTCRSPAAFAHRFVDALFSYASVFDCLDYEEAAMELLVGNALVEEGDQERRGFGKVMRSEVWRTFLGRFGMVELEVSAMVLYQAELVLKQEELFRHGKFCKVGVEGKSLIVSWKGTPKVSISSWKFARLRKHKEQVLSE